MEVFGAVGALRAVEMLQRNFDDGWAGSVAGGQHLRTKSRQNHNFLFTLYNSYATLARKSGQLVPNTVPYGRAFGGMGWPMAVNSHGRRWVLVYF